MYAVTAPKTPGATPSSQPAATLADARRIARTFRDRRDLAGQDVRIEHSDGRLVEYAGPAR
jgi:hypothetical protein